jgi:hypothetical protein
MKSGNKVIFISFSFLVIAILTNLISISDVYAKTTNKSGTGEQAHTLKEALFKGKPDLSFRYRFGYIHEEGLPNRSKPSTLRTLLGYRTKAFYNISAYVQFRNVKVIGSENYNDTLNGKTSYPVEADPSATEVDQAYLQFDGIPDTSVSVGRRKLIFGNERFISDLGWRQNNRSFDGVTVVNSSITDTNLTYAWANNINRAFTDDSPNGNFDEGTSVHLFNASYAGLPGSIIEGYTYLLDLDGIVAPPPSTLSTATYGLNISGRQEVSDRFHFLFLAEYAFQKDYGENPRNIDLSYWHIEPGIFFSGLTLKAGYEVFESDGTSSFSAPLGLLHAFGGWADKFLPAPPNGLEDLYVSAVYKVSDTDSLLDGIKFVLAYHDFSPENGNGNYGRELDAAIVIKFNKKFTISAHYANYDAKSFSTDTQKLWLTLGASFN